MRRAPAGDRSAVRSARLGAAPRAVAVALAMLVLGLVAGAGAPALAGDYDDGSGSPPPSTAAPQRATARPVSAPTRTCRMYGSSSGFGLLCSDAAAGKTLAQLLRGAGIDVTKKYCWDDPDLPDGFVPPRPTRGPGAWWLHTCLTFDGAVISTNANLTYEFVFYAPGEQKRLVSPQKEVIELVTGRGQIPFLQAQTSPVSSPRVDQDVAFSLLCDSKVRCSDTAAGRQVRTPALDVGGVTMYAELIHLKVLPKGAARPEDELSCVGAGLPLTAQELDRTPDDDRRVCRWRYDRSSNDAGGGQRGDRYPARVSAYWQIYYDQGNGPVRLGLPYQKTTVNQMRVTEVQTLVVS